MIVDLYGNQRVPNPPPVPNGTSGLSSYAVGSKRYGAGRSMPNLGPVSGTGMGGYAQRDNEAQARKNAILRRLQGQGTGNPSNLGIQRYTNGV